jgi:hypothetical protein
VVAEPRQKCPTPEGTQTKNILISLLAGLDYLEDYISRPGAIFRRCGPVVGKRHAGNASVASEFVLHTSLSSNPVALAWFGSDTWVLTARQLYEARKIGLIDRLPEVTEDVISDLDKGSWGVKLLTVLQIGWLAAEAIRRTSISITSAPLEIMTLSFAAIAIIIYLFILNHPQDIRTRIYIQASRAPSANDMSAILGSAPHSFWLRTHPDFAIPNTRINSASRKKYNRRAVKVYTLCLTLGSLISGGLHLLAWDFPFPTTPERIIWRIASLVAMLWPTTIGFILFLFYVWIWHGRIRRLLVQLGFDEPAYKRSGAVLGTLIIFTPLILARMFLIFEAARSLYYLPPDAYYSTWTQTTPHIG